MTADVFIKDHGPAVLSDAWRLDALAQICRQVDGVVTAPVRWIDSDRQKIAYDWLSLTMPLGRVVHRPDVFWQVGVLLARMHQVPFSVSAATFSPDCCPMDVLGIDSIKAGLLGEALPQGWFHGDFWHGNVFVLEGGDIAVIDPLPVEFLFPRNYILACGAIDVAMMYMTILAVHPLAKQVGMMVEKHLDAAEAFLDGYLKARGLHSDEVSRALRRASSHLAEVWIQRSSGRLAFPVHALKKAAMKRIIYKVDQITGWGRW